MEWLNYINVVFSVEFFGKVKDKAENVERIIKEKDKHGN